MRPVADALPALISYVDSTLHYRFANKSFDEWYGVAAEDIVGMPVKDVIGETFFDRVAHRFEAVLAGREVNHEDNFNMRMAASDIFVLPTFHTLEKAVRFLATSPSPTTSPKASRPKRSCASPRNRPTPPTGPSHCSSPT